MIVISVLLVSAIHPSRSRELARMEIVNDGVASRDDPTRGDYNVRTLRGKTTEHLNRRVIQREGRVRGFTRRSSHVWNLVAKALASTGYK